MLTREEKIEWIKTATNEELVDQLYWAHSMMRSEFIDQQVSGQESKELLEAEILRRMAK